MLPWAVIPTAGQGTRLRPVTLTVPKVLLPVGVRPMLDWTLAEAARAGVGGIVVVVSPDHEAVRAYVETAARSGPRPDWELPQLLAAVEVHLVEQPRPAGVGEALTRCRPWTGDDPFLVLLPDNWFDAGDPAAAQVGRTLEATGLCTLGLTEVQPEEVGLYGDVGRVELETLGDDAYRILALQDKGEGAYRPRGDGPELRGCARYALLPEFYEALEATRPAPAGADGPEWDDVPAFQALIAAGRLAGQRISGRHFDVGRPTGYLAAQRWLADWNAGDGRSP